MEKREVKDIDNRNPRSLRKALEEIRFFLPYMVQYMSLNRGDANLGGYLDKLIGIIDSALSLKQRNCDREECRRWMEDGMSRLNAFRCKTPQDPYSDERDYSMEGEGNGR